MMIKLPFFRVGFEIEKIDLFQTLRYLFQTFRCCRLILNLSEALNHFKLWHCLISLVVDSSFPAGCVYPEMFGKKGDGITGQQHCLVVHVAMRTRKKLFSVQP